MTFWRKYGFGENVQNTHPLIQNTHPLIQSTHPLIQAQLHTHPLIQNPTTHCFFTHPLISNYSSTHPPIHSSTHPLIHSSETRLHTQPLIQKPTTRSSKNPTTQPPNIKTCELSSNPGLYACIMIVYDRNNTGPPRGNSLNRSMTIFSTDTKRVLAGRHRK